MSGRWQPVPSLVRGSGNSSGPVGIWQAKWRCRHQLGSVHVPGCSASATGLPSRFAAATKRDAGLHEKKK